MDVVTILAVIPGLAPVLPYVAAAVAICAALAVIMPRPTAQSCRLYVLAYRTINFIALNFGHASNAHKFSDTNPDTLRVAKSLRPHERHSTRP